jgi:MerR family transcriptional regulator/heat shock protein HspR
MAERRQTRLEVSVDEDRGVFMISVAAELADMHPQTLRIYEARGLITPKRSPKNTRLYSQRDVEKLKRIQHMTNEEGLNLAGVETVLEMEARVEQMRDELEAMRRRTRELEAKLDEEMRRLHTEIVPYGAYEPDPPVRIPVQRPEE